MNGDWHGKVYNWKTATYGRIWDDDEVHNLRSVETEFSAIVFDDTFSSQVALSCEPTVSPLNDNEIDFKISFDESDDEDYMGKLVSRNGYDVLDMTLPPRDQRHRYLRFEGLEYTDADVMDFEERLGRIYDRKIHRVQVFDFGGLTDLMAEGLSGGVRRRMSWREFILGMGLHTNEEVKSVGFGAYWAESTRQIPDKGDLSAYWVGISSAGDFLGTTPSYTLIRDLMLTMYHSLIACSIAGRSQAPEKVTVIDLFYLRGMDVGYVSILYLLARYLRMFASRRKREAMISGGEFVTRLAEHLGLLTKERLQGLTVIVRDLLVIDMVELIAEGAHDVDEGAQAVPAPVQAPQPPPAAGPTRTMA
ncbi:hypothetical protein Tco_0692657 [Tanacetum coccineum]